MTQQLIEKVLITALVGAIGANELFHGIYGIEIFQENVSLIHLTLTMETISGSGSWRSIDNTVVSQIVAGLTTLAHLVCGLISLVAAYFLVEREELGFKLAYIGVGFGCIFYFLGFITIASAWFLMFRSATINFEAQAERLFLCYMAVLIYLSVIRKRYT
jgi:predicted small integral membrane protein